MDQFQLVRTNPYYLIKKNIYDSIAENAGALTGVLLDFGCGRKPYLNLFRHVREYIGLDYSNEGHDHKSEPVDVYYDGKTIPFPDEYFDSVLASEVFEHVFELDDTIREIARVMKPNGLILITSPFIWPLHEEPHDFARYTPFGLRYLFEKNNFEIIKIERNGDRRALSAQLRIINAIQSHWLLRIPLLNTRFLNNDRFSFRRLVKNWICLSNNWRVKDHNMGSHSGTLYLSNVILARKVR